MKLVIVAVTVLTAAIATTWSAATGSATAALASPAAACQGGKQTTVDSHKAFIFCGPATATLTVGGRTYNFRSGSCIKSGSTVIVEIGETVDGDTAHNGGKPDFSLTLAGDSGELGAYSGGADLLKPGLALVAVPRPSAAGSFHGKNPITAEPFSGSWNCHGAITTA
jgi:hypothetical protein